MKQKSHDISGRHPPRHDAPELKRCPCCRAVGYEDDLYCVRCGTLLAPICMRCGTPISHPIAIYCGRCGEKLNDGTDSDPPFGGAR